MLILFNFETFDDAIKNKMAQGKNYVQISNYLDPLQVNTSFLYPLKTRQKLDFNGI